MQIIQALIFVFAALFGNVDAASVTEATGPGQEGYIWCDAYPNDPACKLYY